MIEPEPERWLPFPDPRYGAVYQISDLGRVKNVRTGRILKPATSNNYKTVGLSAGGRVRSFLLGPAVLKAFRRPPRRGEVCIHKRGKEDVRLESLEWGPQSSRKRIRRKRTTLSAYDVECILKLRHQFPLARVAQFVGVSPATVRRVIRAAENP